MTVDGTTWPHRRTDELRADVAGRDTTIESLRRTVDELQADVEARDVIIESMERTVDALQEELRCRDVDELTGMHNRRWLREFWAGLRSPASAVAAVAFFDVDLLKHINDIHGHKAGDRVITHVAAVLISSGCYAVRHGGDEFLLLVPAGWNVHATLNQIIDNIAECSIPTRDGRITVAVSCGARMVEDGLDLHRMIHDADTAMYEVKRARSGASGCRIVAA